MINRKLLALFSVALAGMSIEVKYLKSPPHFVPELMQLLSTFDLCRLVLS